MTDPKLPSNLIDAIRAKSAILFLGAGASFDATHPKGDKIPMGNQQCRAILAPMTGQDATQPHGFHTMALLAFDEVREEEDRIEACSQAGGSLEAIERVFLERLGDLQKAIQAGLSRFPGDPRLLSVEADYLVLLSKSDQAFRSLERAFRKNPRIDWIATRLARMYVDRGDYKHAVETLRTCLRNNANSKDANYQIGILLSDRRDEAERKSSIEYLRRAFTIGDANYNAQSWYARALFLEKYCVEANRIFAHLRNVALPSESKRRTFGIVKDLSGNIQKFSRLIAKAEEGFAFCSVDGFEPDIFAPRSAFGDAHWQLGTRIVCSIGFTLRGPIIDEAALLM